MEKENRTLGTDRFENIDTLYFGKILIVIIIIIIMGMPLKMCSTVEDKTSGGLSRGPW